MFLSQALRQAKAISYRTALSHPYNRLLRNGLPVFAFHNIEPSARWTARPGDYCHPSTFGRYLSALDASGYKTVSLDSLTSRIALPALTMVLTFDDGYASAVRNALPHLQRHKMLATMFLVSSSLERRDLRDRGLIAPLADASMIREWLAAGHQIGSHSVSHLNLTKLSTEHARDEMRISKDTLEQAFGVSIKHFAFPYGAWNQHLNTVAGSVGYQTASTMIADINTLPLPLFLLKRIQPIELGQLAFHTILRIRNLLPRERKELMIPENSTAKPPGCGNACATHF